MITKQMADMSLKDHEIFHKYKTDLVGKIDKLDYVNLVSFSKMFYDFQPNELMDGIGLELERLCPEQLNQVRICLKEIEIRIKCIKEDLRQQKEYYQKSLELVKVAKNLNELRKWCIQTGIAALSWRFKLTTLVMLKRTRSRIKRIVGMMSTS